MRAFSWDDVSTGENTRKEGSGGLRERMRSLKLSRSQPELRSVRSEAAGAPEIVVLGREARSKSRRFVLSEDGTLLGGSTPHAPGASSCVVAALRMAGPCYHCSADGLSRCSLLSYFHHLFLMAK
jgi:hypothetical protein